MEILVPLDFSEAADNAKLFASEIAKVSGSELVFLHAVPPQYNFASLAEEEKSATVAGTAKILKRYVKELSESRIAARYRVVDKELDEAVKMVLEEAKIGLIIMGTEGAKGLKKLLLGANTVFVLENISVPLLIVPPGALFQQIKKIVIVLEHFEDTDISIAETLQLTANWGLPYEVIHFDSQINGRAVDQSKNHLREIEEKFPGITAGSTNIRSANVRRGLNLFQKEHPECLMVMIRYHRGLMESLVHKSNTRWTASHTNVPLLVLYLK